MAPQATTTTYLDAIRHLPPGGVLVIPDVSWTEYEDLLGELGDGYAVRVAYDQGRLEVVTPSGKHEKWKELTQDVARVLAEELGLELESFGATTFRREELKRGAEPDTCFYVQHALAVIGREEIDLAVDPPPDVMVEVDVSHSSDAKLAFYAQLAVPEVWRYDGERVGFFQLVAGTYQEATESRVFPGLTPAMLQATLEGSKTRGQTAALRAFRATWRARPSG